MPALTKLPEPAAIMGGRTALMQVTHPTAASVGLLYDKQHNLLIDLQLAVVLVRSEIL